MTIKKQYSVERIQALLAELEEFNSNKLTDIELLQNGVVMNIPWEVIEEWRFVGMSNQAFVELEYWNSDLGPLIGDVSGSGLTDFSKHGPLFKK